LLKTFVEGVDEPVFIKNRDGKIILANKALSHVMGESVEQIIGKTDIDIYKDSGIAKEIMDHDDLVFQTKSTLVFEENIKTPEGERIYLTTKTPWLDLDQNVLGLLGVAHDITSRKKLEVQLNEKATELESKNKLITDFFINITHELKTPLSIILSCMELLEQNKDDDKSMIIMQKNCYQLCRLVLNLLDLSKIDAGFFEPSLEYIDIVAFCKQTLDSSKLYASKKQISLNEYYSHEKRIVCTDIFMIERILLNLLSNAIKFTPIGGSIVVRCIVDEAKLLISVKDTGEGIPSAKKDLIFNRFMQLDSSLKRSRTGCGVGLALTKSVTELLGGRIWFCSKEGEGSEFFVELPLLNKASNNVNIVTNNLQFDKRVQIEFSDLLIDCNLLR